MIPDDTTLPLDPWTASSLLHKAIRRGEEDYAQIAAQAFFRYRGQSIWRRLMVIAYEDIGIGNLDLVANVTRLGSDRAARQGEGVDIEVALMIAKALAGATKDRSSDYLPYIALEHPDWAQEREDIAGLHIGDRLPIALDPGQPLIRRAIATLYLVGLDAQGRLILNNGYHLQLLRGFENRGLPVEMAECIDRAARKTREPITMMLPLIWASLQHTGEIPAAMERSVPASPKAHGIPLYTFDMHTRIGKKAAGIFANENSAVNASLGRYVAEYRMRDAAAIAACYVDAIPLARQLVWHEASGLATAGLEADMMKFGCPKHAVLEIVETIRDNLDHLNFIRGGLLNQSLRNRFEAEGQ